MRLLFVFLFFILLKTSVFAQIFQQGADTVVKFTPGAGNSHGQNSQFFPMNVLGLPSKTAGEYSAETREEEICALNFGGEIIIGFKNAVIIDAPGADFTIFENAFKSPIPPYIFAEPAKVAVSRDGIIFKEFPFDSLSLKGCAGMTPTYGNKNPFDLAESGGDSFDLADIGMDSVRFIKITDITALLKPGHPFYQATLTGFDLDAVVGIHLILPQKESASKQIFIKQKDNILTIYSGEVLLKEAECEIYSLDGKQVFKEKMNNGMLEIPLKTFPKSAFIAVLKGENFTTSQKFIVE